jgi:hypothetical protein
LNNRIVAERVVAAIIYDLSDRRGLSHEWETIDDDIREQIIETWTKIVVANLVAANE